MKSLLLQGLFSLLLLALFYAQFPRHPILEHAQSQRVGHILARIKSNKQYYSFVHFNAGFF